MGGAADNDTEPGDVVRRESARERLRDWLLLTGDRRTVTGAILAVLFGALVVLGAVDPSPLRAVMTGSDPVETLFQGLVGGIITGVTLVVTINQLVLTQELVDLGAKRDRMQASMSFREDVEAAIEPSVASPDPAEFLVEVVDEAVDQARELDSAVESAGDEQVRARTADFVDTFTGNAETALAKMEGADFGSFHLLSAALDFNYSWELYRARRLRVEFADDLPAAGADALDDLIELMEFYAPGREHVKSLYFQWALVDLSRVILFAAVPALVVSMGGLLYVDEGVVAGSLLGVDAVVWLVAALATAALVPFVVLLSYILRIATVAKRTLAIGPFVLRGQPDTSRREDGD